MTIFNEGPGSSGRRTHSPLGVSVRRAVLDDVGPIQELLRAHAEFERLSNPPEHAAASLLARNDVGCWVAVLRSPRKEARLVGYSTLTQDYSTLGGASYAHMDCLFVHEGYRGYGVGQQLVEEMIGYCNEIGLGELQWQTPVWNAGAVRFYQRLGARMTEKARFSLQIS